MILDLGPAIESLSLETRTALFERANREGVSVGELVKGILRNRLDLDELEDALAEGERLTSLSLDNLFAGSRFSSVLHRCAEIDAALELKPGHGIAESFLGGILDDIERGEYGLIIEGWEFDDELGERWASEKLAGLAASWKAEGEGRDAA